MRHRNDIATLLDSEAQESGIQQRAVNRASETLRAMPLPVRQITDEVARWYPPRIVVALKRHGIDRLAHLTVRIPRLRGWWRVVPGFGERSARQIETFFVDHPPLPQSAWALVAPSAS